MNSPRRRDTNPRFIAALAITALATGCTTAKKSTESTPGTTVTPLSTAVATTAAPTTTIDRTIRTVQVSKITPLDANKTGRTFDASHFLDGRIAIGGLTFEKSQAVNTLWQGTTLESLVPTRIGDGDFDVRGVVQLPQGVLVLGDGRNGSVGKTKFVKADGTVEDIDVSKELGPGVFYGDIRYTKNVGLVAIWWNQQTNTQTLVTTVDGRVWKKLDFFDPAEFSSVLFASVDDGFLVVATDDSGEKPVVKTFTFNATGILAEATSLRPSDLYLATLSNGPGGPIFSSEGKDGNPQLWRYANGKWTAFRSKFRRIDGPVESRTIESLVSDSTSWYAVGWAQNFRQVWRSTDGISWSAVGAPGLPAVREETVFGLLETADRTIVQLNDSLFAAGKNSLERLANPLQQNPTVDVDWSATWTNDQWHLAASTGSGSSNNERSVNIYELDKTGTGSKLKQKLEAMAVTRSGVVGRIFVFTSLVSPGSNRSERSSDDVYGYSNTKDPNTWDRVAGFSFLRRSTELLNDATTDATSTLSVIAGSVTNNETQFSRVMVQPTGRLGEGSKPVEVKLGTVGDKDYNVGTFGDVATVSRIENGKLLISTLNETGIIGTQQFVIPSETDETGLRLFRYPGRSEIYVESTPPVVLAFDNATSKYNVASSSRWVSNDASGQAKLKANSTQWSSPTADIDAWVREDTSSGKQEIELYVNGSSVGTYPLLIDWTDGYDLTLLDATPEMIRFVASHDGFISIAEAPTPTAAATAMRTAKPRT
jgi:hypothetical protein